MALSIFSLFPLNLIWERKVQQFDRRAREMGSSDGTDTVVTEGSDLTFPAADVDSELNLGDNNSFEVDPISSKVATSLDMKAEEIKAAEREEQRKEALQTLKTTIVVSAVVVAVAGAVFAIVKKLRET